jgi:hypothetical protein
VTLGSGLGQPRRKKKHQDQSSANQMLKGQIKKKGTKKY